METLEYLMKKLKQKKIDDAVLTFSANHSRQIKFANNKIVKTGVEELRNIGIFVVKDKKILTTNCHDLIGESGLSNERGDFLEPNKKGMDKLVRKIFEFLKLMQPKKDYYGINEKKFKYKEIGNTYDPKAINIDEVDYAERGINAALKEGARRTNGILEVHDVKSTVLTSNEIMFNEKRSELYFSIRSLIEEDESGHMNSLSTSLKKFNVEEAGKTAGKIAKDSRNPSKGSKGNYDIIFGPMAIIPLLNIVGEGASIFSVEAGLSFFAGRQGKKVGSPDITLYDDGRLDGGVNSTKADDEGVATRRNVLIEKGIFKQYLHNTSTARKYKVESTGNAGLISPGPWNIVVERGRLSLPEMIKEVKNGIYVTNVWYTRFANYHSGDFSTIPRDGTFLIKNGKVIGSLKNIRISENILRLLKNVDCVGNKARYLRSWEARIPTLTPPILIRNCKITAPTS
ncbi:TldD/PmbA family protein [Candidatus Woesearchaeota archaeon]|nr:TldD/PmbA family protein [Candidatus Woesearchaeota archaeon]